MPKVSTQEFEQLPLRVHTFLAGVPLHDVWFVDLPRWRAGVTLDDFLRTANNCLFTPSSLVRMLLGIRLFVGRFFDWDRKTAAISAKTFATSLSVTDHWRAVDVDITQDRFFS